MKENKWKKRQVMKKVAEKGAINIQLVVDSPGKGQQDLEKGEGLTDSMQKEQTTVWKGYDNYHTNLTKQKHVQTKQSQPIKIPGADTDLKDKKVEDQTKKLEREGSITYNTEITGKI